MSALPRVSAIVVSYEVRELLRRCLVTLAGQRGIELETWVVDNASSDGSADLVASEFSAARLIRNPANVGFARANNQALAQATGEYLALINPDTELPANALATVVQVFGRHPSGGAVGLALRNADGSPQSSCRAFPGVLNQALEWIGLHRLFLRLGVGGPSAAPVPRGGEGPVDWVSGACLILSRRAFERVGGLDESRFMYGEEMDWSWRARLAGFETIYSEAARVLHHEGASGTGMRAELFVHNVESRLAFLRRHRGAWRAALAREVIALGSLARLVKWRLRATLEARTGNVRPSTSAWLERFRAVVRWRWGGAA